MEIKFMDLIKRNKRIILYLLTVVLFGVFYYFLPFAGDDWAWGSDIGIDRLKNGFDGYNGRYLGNILIILATRSVIFKVLFCALIMFLLIFILNKIFDNLSHCKGSTINYIVAFSSVLILVLPNQISFGDLQPFQIFGSTVGWLSGFTNYVVPSVLILIFYYFVTSKGYENKAVYVLLIVDGVLSCLCVEHYTLFCLLFSLGVIAYRYYHYKRICKKSLFFFLGSLIGTAVMFSNSAYRLMQKGDVSNNQRAAGFFGSLKKYADYIFPADTNSVLIIAFEIILLAVIVAFLVFFFLKSYKAFKNKNILQLLPVVCMVVMTLPLLFTNSGKEIYVVAPRCYFLQYFMLVVYLYGKFFKNKKTNDYLHDKKLKLITSACLVLLVSVTAVCYGFLDCIGLERDKSVNASLENGNSTIEIIEYPKQIEHIQWSSNFIENETYLERYKKFKGIPEDKKVILVSNNN